MIAFFDNDVGDSTKALGSNVRVCSWFHFTGSGDLRDKSILLGDLRRLNGDYTFVRLVNTKDHYASEQLLRRQYLFRPFATSSCDSFHESPANHHACAGEL